jgi:predicted nucleic acid-binding protein
MQIYFDTSLVLSILQGEPSAYEASRIWDECEVRYSSLLLRAEALVSLRRAATGKRGADTELLARREGALRQMLSDTNLVPVDSPVVDVIEKERELARCRSQDALHLATAMYIRRETGEPLVICSLDGRMRETARMLRFEVLPAW